MKSQAKGRISYQNQSITQVEQALSADGYACLENDAFGKQDGEIVYRVKPTKSENDIWGVFYCYPAEAEEGWGSALPVIADTFTVLLSSDDGQIRNSAPAESGTSLGDEDRQEILTIVEEFAEAYFHGNVDAIEKFLVSPYDWDITAYEGTGTISELTLKGLPDNVEQTTDDGQYIVSLEHRNSDYADIFHYLTISFVQQEDGWKILFYGIEV